MAGLGKEGVFQGGDYTLHRGGAAINAILDSRGQAQSHGTFALPEGMEVRLTRDPAVMNTHLDNLRSHQLDPKTESVGVSVGPEEIQKDFQNRVIQEKIHRTEQIERLGERAGVQGLKASTLAKATATVSSVKDIIDGHKEGTYADKESGRNQGKDGRNL